MSNKPDPIFYAGNLVERLRVGLEPINMQGDFTLTSKQYMNMVHTMREGADEIELLQKEAKETLRLLEDATRGVRRPISERQGLNKVIAIIRGWRK
jgi:hypothetical protein